MKISLWANALNLNHKFFNREICKGRGWKQTMQMQQVLKRVLLCFIFLMLLFTELNHHIVDMYYIRQRKRNVKKRFAHIFTWWPATLEIIETLEIPLIFFHPLKKSLNSHWKKATYFVCPRNLFATLEALEISNIEVSTCFLFCFA